MRKSFKLLGLLVVAMIGFTAWSCSDDDKAIAETVINFDQLPKAAREFVTTYYPSAQTTKIERDADNGRVEFDVLFSTGDEVTFDSDGQWIDVDAPFGKTIPDGIAPEAIVKYVTDNYSGAGINEISRNAAGYDVDLTTGTDLLFDLNGNFIRVEK